MRHTAVGAALAALLLAALGAGAAVEVYPGFRGDGTGRTDAKNLPREWSPRTITWQTKLPGYGQSSPVVYRGKVFITAVEGTNKEKCLIAAYDAISGKKLWQKELAATQQAKSTTYVSKAAPTPVVDADRLYVFFESGELAAFGHDGKLVWVRSLVKEYGEFKNGHGLSSSLAQTADSVFVLIDHQGPSYLLAVNKATGKNRWKVERKSRTSWTSPVVVRHGKKDLLVISSGGSVDTYDTAKGTQLSSYTDVGNNNVPSAVVQGDRVVVGASLPQRSTNAELSIKSCCCLTLDADGKLSKKPVWTSEKATASFASPLIHKGCAYYLNSTGVLACLDLKTGKQHYMERIGHSCWASPVGAGDHVYLFGRAGVTVVIKAGAKFEKVATNSLWETKEAKTDAPAKGKGAPGRFSGPTVYGVAMTDGAIYVRTGTVLYAVRGK